MLQKVDMTDVPGMSPMDVDGVDGQAVDDISTVISLLTVGDWGRPCWTAARGAYPQMTISFISATLLMSLHKSRHGI